jgi:cytochrome P450
MAGSDTTSNALRSIMLYVAATPRAYAKLQQEIDDAAATGGISSPVKFAETRNLPYLQVCLGILSHYFCYD